MGDLLKPEMVIPPTTNSPIAINDAMGKKNWTAKNEFWTALQQAFIVEEYLDKVLPTKQSSEKTGFFKELGIQDVDGVVAAIEKAGKLDDALKLCMNPETFKFGKEIASWKITHLLLGNVAAWTNFAESTMAGMSCIDIILADRG